MKNNSTFGILFLIMLLFLSLNCSSHGTSDVTIHINLGLNNASAANTFENSIFDRIFRLFSKDAEAAPSNVTSIILNISGSGMETISNTYPSSTTSIELEVPSGPSRLFEVLAHTPSVTFRGAVTESLVGGSTVTIPITMALYETKIVIPDYYNYRIVQIDDISGAGWSVRSTISGISNLVPYDIDFDSIGRIYIANNYASTGGDVIIRIDSISGSDTLSFGGNGSGYVAIAIDRTNSFIYCARGGVNTIWRYTLPNGTSPSQITLTGITFTGGIRGLAVDDYGNLYIAATTTGPVQEVIKCTPGSPSTNVIRYSTGLVTPWDVVVKGNYLYVANRTVTGVNNQIIQLNTNLTSPVGFGQNIDAVNTTLGNFYGPRRFLAILNRKFTIIDDEDQANGNFDKLVSMDDILGTNWVTYGTQGSGTGQFNFYNFC